MKMIFEKNRRVLLKILGVVLGILCFCLLLIHDAYEANEFEEMERIISASSTRIFITLLRALTSGGRMAAILFCFFDFPYLSGAVRYFSPMVCILNIVFYKLNFACYLGNEYTASLLVVRTVGFVLENLLIFTLSFLAWFEYLKNKSRKTHSKKDSLTTVCFILFATVFTAPATTLLSLHGGKLGYNSREFNFFHIVSLIFCVALIIGLTLLFKNKPYKTRRFICCFFSLALLFGFFSRYDFVTYKELFVQLANHRIPSVMDCLPLQLCNFGVILSFIAYIFQSKKIFYFNFFGNFFGFVMGLLLPKIYSDFFRPTTVHYWQNHIYGFLLIVLGLSLSIFDKPSKKDLKNSLFLFLGYFVFVMTLDVWFGYDTNTKTGCDFFFLNSSTYSDILHIGFMREDPFVIHWTDGNGFEYRIYTLYWIVVYTVYSLLMATVYFGTKLFYKSADKIGKSKQ